MSNANPWTTKEKQLMREQYALLGPSGMSRIVAHSPMSCRTMAGAMGLKVEKQVISRARSARCKAIGKAPTPKPRQPFDDLPEEFIKVNSIFRVGQRYAMQETICES